jgi:hypothetical protein
MMQLPRLESIHTSKDYDGLLKALYASVKPRAQEIEIPPVRALCVSGNETPASRQYQQAIAVLYGIGYSLKMGLKYGKLARPAGYFDYKVGALETLWWSTAGELDIANPATLRWQAYLMVPAFVTGALIAAARDLAKAKHPDLPYESATLQTLEEGRSVQMLHVGPYDQERPTIAVLERYVADHGLAVTGRHHEIYISDPRRTRPEKLKTVIRLAVAPASRAAAG